MRIALGTDEQVGAMQELCVTRTVIPYSPRGTSQVAPFAFVARRARGGPLHVASVSETPVRGKRECVPYM